MSDETKVPASQMPATISPEEFRSAGYLQEVNRQFLHRLGLAMGVVYEGDRAVGYQIYDDRDDLTGWQYGPGVMSKAKEERIALALALRDAARQEALGYVVQPVDGASE